MARDGPLRRSTRLHHPSRLSALPVSAPGSWKRCRHLGISYWNPPATGADFLVSEPVLELLLEALMGKFLTSLVDELYDVVPLSDARRPMALGFKTDEIRRLISLEA